MKDPYIINTHSHANMLKETPPEFALQTAQAERIITIVPSCNSQDIFEVDEFMNVKMVSEGAKHVIENWNRRVNDGKTD